MRRSSTFTVDTPFISDSVPLADGVLGTVEEICVHPGDSVKENDIVIVVDTHKAALEVRAQCEGTVKQVLVKVGDEIQERKPVVLLTGEP